MIASEMGSADWWLVVQSSPMEDALRMLNDYKASVIEKYTGTPEYITAGTVLTRVNAELKRLNYIRSQSAWQLVCKRVLPEDMYQEVYSQVRIAEMGEQQ
jgi:hypothetical protein